MVCIYRKHVSEPWFSLICVGIKTIEGRLNQGDWADMEEGDQIDWFNKDFTPVLSVREIRTSIINKTHYPCIESYLNEEGLNKTLPSITNLEDGLKVYHTYYKPEDIEKYGVVALELKVISKY